MLELARLGGRRFASYRISSGTAKDRGKRLEAIRLVGHAQAAIACLKLFLGGTGQG